METEDLNSNREKETQQKNNKVLITKILLDSEQNGKAFRPFNFQKNTSNLKEIIISKFSKSCVLVLKAITHDARHLSFSIGTESRHLNLHIISSL